MQYPEYQQQHLTPEQYLTKFRTPHSVINSTYSENSKEDFEILQKILDVGYNDTEQTKNLKEKALSQLKDCVKKWLLKINPNVSPRCGLEIFGSFRTGVNSRDSDIDAVIIAPTYIDRNTNFFEDFVAQLQANPNITELFPIPTALIPLIKLNLYGVQFDILMSQIPDRILETNFQFDNQILDLIDQRERKNINGCRMVSYLQKNISNMETFKITLKAIKMWARNRGVYLQMFSYLGGIGYTILLAKIMQLYPNYSPLKLLSRFFYIYSKWAWQIPVILQQNPAVEFQKSQMTIMTPINPTMNTSHSVSKTTLRIMRRQFKQAYKTIEQIQKGSKTWNALFAPYNIIKKHKHFLQISIMANKKTDHIMWKGHIQSKFRKLLKLLESNSQYGNMIQVHPFPKQFISKHPNYKFCSKYYTGIRCKSYNIQDDTKEVDFTQHIRMFLQIIEIYNDIDKMPQHINIGIARVAAQSIGTQLSKNVDTFYKHQ